MKFFVLYAIVASAFSSGIANAAEIYNKDGNKLNLYGRVQVLHYFSDDSTSDGDKTYIRFGFNGQTQINEFLTGYGQWEYHLQGNNSEGSDSNNNTKTRLGFAGLKFGNIGTFDYGRNYGVIYDVLSTTDTMPEFSGPNANADTFLRQRSTGVATFRTNDTFGIYDKLKLAFQFQGKNDRPAISRANGDGWGASIRYDLGYDVTLAAAYSNSDRTDAQNASGVYGKGRKAENWATGLKFDNGKWYFAALYGYTLNSYYFTNMNTNTSGFANKADYFDVTLQYQFINGLRPALLYVQTKGNDIEGIGKADLLKFIEPALSYYFNKNMRAYVAYKINLMPKNNNLSTSAEDVLATGLVYQF